MLNEKMCVFFWCVCHSTACWFFEIFYSRLRNWIKRNEFHSTVVFTATATTAFYFIWIDCAAGSCSSFFFSVISRFSILCTVYTYPFRRRKNRLNLILMIIVMFVFIAFSQCCLLYVIKKLLQHTSNSNSCLNIYLKYVIWM